MATSEPASGPSSPLVGARVLVAEDDALVALDLMTTLQTAGYVVVGPVSSVAEARTIIDGEPPDAALLDLQFADAGADAAPVAAALLAGDVPFAVLTDGDGLELEPALAGAPRLAKPVRPEALLSTVHDLLEGREAPSPPG
jgi:DNA-binding response OmpR family regulator